MSVSVVFDPFKALDDGGFVSVRSPEDYVEVCEAVELAIGGQKPLAVLVTNPAMRTWFDRFRNDAVAFRQIDPCELLASQLGVSVAQIPVEIRQDPVAIVTE